MTRLVKSASEMVAEARGRIDEIGTAELIGMMNEPGILIVDIRDIRERQRTGFIPGSFHAPRGMFEFWIDPDSPQPQESLRPKQEIRLPLCLGWRSALTVATLQEMGFASGHLKNGFSDWVKNAGPAEHAEDKKGQGPSGLTSPAVRRPAAATEETAGEITATKPHGGPSRVTSLDVL